MSSAATAAGVAVGLIALVLVAYRGRVAGPGIAAAPAAIAVGYGLIMATSLAGAGIGLLRTLLLSLLPAVALLIADRVAPLLPDAANDRGGPAGAGVVASLAAGAAIAMIGESLSLFGGLGRIGTAVAITLVLVLLVWGSGLRGATAALRASLAIAAVLAGLLLLVGLVVGGPGALLGPTLPPQGLPPGAGWSLSATVLLVALADPALRPRLPAPDWPTTALRRSGAVVLVLLPALTGAAVLFGGSFFSPSSQFFAAWFSLPAAVTTTVLCLLVVALGGLAAGFLEGAGRAFRLHGPEPGEKPRRHPDAVPPGLLVAAAIAAVSGTVVGSPGALLLLAAIAAAGSLGGAVVDPGTPVRRWIGWAGGAAAGGATMLLLGLPGALTFSWIAMAPLPIAALAAIVTSAVAHRLGRQPPA